MDFIIVTGMSGSGKTKVLDALEDIGYYCCDNIPPQFLMQFAGIFHDENRKIKKMALFVDSRGLDLFQSFVACLKDLEDNGYSYKLIFLDADNKILINRYKEGRRKHHLADKENYSISDAIKKERQMLESVKDKADFLIDTSLLAPSQLKTWVADLCLLDESQGLTIVCMSFGFKNGLPREADLVFDLRCLPNPFYIPELKEHTGLEKEVSTYVMNHQESIDFYDRIYDLIDFSLPLYVKEGKSCLHIAMGCTGGKHRSVTFAERLSAQLSEREFKINIVHRDINKPNQY